MAIVKKISVKAQITLEGRTYLPGEYAVVVQDPTNTQVTARLAVKLLADYAGMVHEVGASKKRKKAVRK